MSAAEEDRARRAAALLDWYSTTKRELPWRDVTDPYLVLVSEVMLQQTQASRVIPFFDRFVARFPTVESLAASTLPDVLGLWSGLGYNSRAMRLRQAAQVVAGAGWPDTVDGLQALPGVGPYTAAAVACFGFGQPVATIDTNVRRVISRWRGTPLTTRGLTTAAAEELTAPASEWNQAVMDLGATICLPHNPGCSECPVAAWCAGPDAYRPPPRQAVFAGSNRQARGAIVRSLLEGPGAARSSLADRTGLEPARLDAAIAGLVEEGMVTITASGELSLAES